MSSSHQKTSRRAILAAIAGFIILGPTQAFAQTDVLTNGSFESGLTSWTTATHQQTGATGTCSYNGATAPGTETLTSLAGFPATAGTQIVLGSVASTASGGSIISCILYQDVTIPAGATTATVSFDIGVKGAINGNNNGYKVGIYPTTSVPGYTTAALYTAGFASLSSADTTMQSKTSASLNVSSHAGQTVRFAIINAVQENAGQVIGVDNVKFLVTSPSAVPALSTWSFAGLALLLACAGAWALRLRSV
jgi:hypothetical protein